MGGQTAADIVAESLSTDGRARRRLRRAALGMVGGLLIEFLAGMLVNLFAMIPDSHPGSDSAEYLGGSFDSVRWALSQGGLPALAFHASWGLLLIANGVVLIILARRVGRRSVTVSTVFGFLLVVGAGFNGASFLDFRQDYSSMLMATLFGLAMLAYAVVLFLLPADT
jgi:hypothetical protein